MSTKHLPQRRQARPRAAQWPWAGVVLSSVAACALAAFALRDCANVQRPVAAPDGGRASAPAGTLASPRGRPTPEVPEPLAEATTEGRRSRTIPAEVETPSLPPASALDSKLDVIVLRESNRSPVAGARVILTLIRESFAGSRTTSEELVTDATGTASLSFPPVGLHERLSAFVTARGEPHLVGKSRIAEVRAGKGPVYEVLVRPGVVVHGTVSAAASGRPIPGAHVRISTADFGEPVTTDERGRYFVPFFPVHPSGEALKFSSPEHGRESVQLAARDDGACHVRLPESMDRGWQPAPCAVDVQLPEALAIVGRVVGSDGVPIPAVEVVATGYYRMGAIGFPDRADAMTDPGGEFALQGLRADISHELRVGAPRHATLLVELAASSNGVVDIGTLSMSPPAIVRGVVRDAEGFPAAGLEIKLVQLGDERISAPSTGAAGVDRDARMRLPFGTSTTTDSSGVFLVGRLIPGRYELTARSLGRRVLREEVRALQELQSEVCEMVLDDAEGFVSGVVVSGTGNAVSSRPWVVLSRYEERRVLRARLDGTFRFSGVAPDRAYQIQAFVTALDGLVEPASPIREVNRIDQFVEIRLVDHKD